MNVNSNVKVCVRESQQHQKDRLHLKCTWKWRFSKLGLLYTFDRIPFHILLNKLEFDDFDLNFLKFSLTKKMTKYFSVKGENDPKWLMLACICAPLCLNCLVHFSLYIIAINDQTQNWSIHTLTQWSIIYADLKDDTTI